MLDFLRNRWIQGTRTSPFPQGGADFPERFRGRPSRDSSRCPADCRDCREAAPSSLFAAGPDGRAALDLGACLFSPEESAACPHGSISYTPDFRLAARRREDLVSDSGQLPEVRALDARARRLFGRSLRLRSVVAGSCGGCEAELTALGNVVFDLARFGIQFVASPRHADGLVITGAVNPNMRDALYRVWEATPEPRLLIAVGACAISGGPFRGSPEVGNGVPADLPVDLWIAGCPPHPLTVLDGLLRLLGRLEDGSRAVAGSGPAGPGNAG
jgi:Ni,Fe-hydrogenase III small subunit